MSLQAIAIICLPCPPTPYSGGQCHPLNIIRPCVCVCACMCACACVHMCVCAYMCVCMCVHMRVFAWLCECVHMRACVRMLVCVCACACSHVCVLCKQRPPLASRSVESHVICPHASSPLPLFSSVDSSEIKCVIGITQSAFTRLI